MEDMLIEKFGIKILFIIPIIAGIFTSLVSDVLDYYTPENWRGRYLLLIVSIVICLLVTWNFPKTIDSIQERVFVLVFNVFFAILFYNTTGKGIMTKIINLINKKLEYKNEIK
jgi:hypothetical protein